MTVIDLSQLPPPDVVEPLDFETILAELVARLQAELPEYVLLESDPAHKLLEIAAYRELLLRARINDAARSVMLAYAAGADLEHLAALFDVTRLTLDPGDPAANPPVPPTLESDASLRRRAQMALEGETVAGSRGSYIFHALSASGLVKDVAVDSPVPGDVRVTVLSTEGDGTPSAELLSIVLEYLSAEDRRPLTDTVTVEAAEIVPFSVSATLNVYPGMTTAPILAAADAAVQAYVDEHAKLGHDITLSGLYAALHQPGVQRVILASPAADMAIGPQQVSHCTGIAIALGVTDV